MRVRVTPSCVLAATLAAGPALVSAEPDVDLHGHAAPSVVVDYQAPRSAPADPAELPDPDWVGLGPFGGDVEAVAESPTAPGVVLAGIAPASGFGGALWRSTDSAATWSIVPDLDGVSVFDVAFAPDGTAYVGTIDGVWESTDEGATWTNLPLGIGVNDQVLDVEISPFDADTIFAGVADALGSQLQNVLRTTDGGATWQNVTPLGAAGTACTGVEINPNDANTVYACFGGAFGGGSFWVSTNGGTAWVNRSAGLPVGPPLQDVQHDGSRVLVSGGLLFGSQFFGLWASDDEGVTWNELSDNTWPNLVNNAIAVDPNDADRLIVASAGSGAFESTDAGATWAFGVGGSDGLSLLDANFAPGSSDVIYLGANSVGVVKSDDSGATFDPSSAGIGALNTISIAANPNDDSEVAVAFQGLNDGGVFVSSNGGLSWELADLPGTRFNTVAFAPDGTLYSVSDGPTTIAPEGLYRRNNDDTWTSIGPDQGALFESELFPIAFSQNDADLFFTGGSDFGVAGAEPTVWRTTDSGANWEKVYEGPIANEDVTDIEILPDTGDQTLVASFTDFGSNPQTGGVLRSVDGGSTWNNSGAGLDLETQGQRLAVSTTEVTTVLLADSDTGTGNGGVWQSVDGGQNWTLLAQTGSVRAIAVDPADPQIVYIARNNTDEVVFASEDGGSTFAPFTGAALGVAGFPNELATSKGSPNRLLLATGTGSFASDIAGDCAADCNGDGATNILDFVCFQGLFSSGDPGADCNGDGNLNVLDFTCFQAVFAAGCP